MVEVKESTIQSKIMKYLNSLEGCKAVKFHGGAYGNRGTPDILASYNGRFLALEVKRPKVGKVTRLQEVQLEQWIESGAEAKIVTSVDEVRQIITSLQEVFK